MLKKSVSLIVATFIVSLILVPGAMAQSQTIVGTWERASDAAIINFEGDGSGNFKGILIELTKKQIKLGFTEGENIVNAQWEEDSKTYIRHFIKSRSSDGSSKWQYGSYTIVNANRLRDEKNTYLNRVSSATFSAPTKKQPAPSTSSKPGANYVGCFKDSAYARDMTGYTFAQNDMSTEACISICSQKGYSYAATQFGSHCFCDNKYGGQGSATNCDMNCSGNSDQICGGHSANSVYRIRAALAPSQTTGASANTSAKGEWQLVANGHKGVMEISDSQGSYHARFKFDGGWEDMLELQIQGNSISFLRAHAQQRYIGVIQGNSITGTFNQGGSGSYQWQASRTSPQASPSVSSAVKPGQPVSLPGSASVAITIYNNWNKAAVMNGPTRNTQFSTNTPVTITSILNYHWNNGKGHTIGTISLKGNDGRVYGPWQANGLPSAVPAANWIAKPNVTIPAGTYTVIDSHWATWSQNSGSNGSGFSNISGY
jgi:hypothetical protein